MSEFWVSGKKYFCDFCRIYVVDNKASRQAHETGFKHKNNLARHLREVHRAQDRKTKEDAITKRILEKVERTALKHYERDVLKGRHQADSMPHSAMHSAVHSAAQTPHQSADGHQITNLASTESKSDELTDPSKPSHDSPDRTDIDTKVDTTAKDGNIADDVQEGPFGAWTVVEPIASSTMVSETTPAEAFAESRRLKRQKPDKDLKGGSAATLASTSQGGSASLAGFDQDDDTFADDTSSFQFVEKKAEINHGLQIFTDEVSNVAAPSIGSTASLFKKRRRKGIPSAASNE